jgi:alkanesulfonate monooxygenase SsuD/methylene tetrahydromethanopterin reductase-like flavin-dependent oxidoreductase (luciferase family)
VTHPLGVGLWTLQSSVFGPANFTDLYRRFAEDVELAEHLGFHSAWIAEHRLWYDGYCPALLHAQAFAAGRTSRIRLGQAMLIAAQHDPVGLARAAKTLEAITGDRLELGLGLGHRDAEFDALGLRRNQRNRLMEAVLEEIDRETSARIWIGGMGARTLERAATRGYGLMLPQTLYTHELQRVLDEYHGFGGHGTIGIMRDVWVEPDPARAERVRERVLAHYLEEAGAWWVLKGTVGFTNPEQLKRQAERVVSAGIVGPAEEIAERLRADVEAGIELHAIRLNYDFVSQPELQEQMHRLAEEVAPLL